MMDNAFEEVMTDDVIVAVDSYQEIGLFHVKII